MKRSLESFRTVSKTNPESDPARLASALDLRKVVQILPHGSLVEVTAAIWGETSRGVAEIAHGRAIWHHPGP